MFTKNLADSLKNIQDKKDHDGVLAFLIGEQLSTLTQWTRDKIHKKLWEYYGNNAENYNYIVNHANDPAYPIIFCCYALIVDDINKLDREKLDYAIAWLEDKSEENSFYLQIKNSLQAIQHVLNYQKGEKLELPSSICYLNLSGANLESANLDGINLQSANLIGANLTHASMNSANLSLAYLQNAKLDHAKLKHAQLTGADLSNAELNEVDMEKADASDAIFNLAKIRKSNLDTTCLDRSVFIETDLYQTNLHKTSLHAAKLSRANLAETCLFNADLSLVYADKSDLQKANLQFAKLNGTRMVDCNLTEAVLNFSEGSHLHATNTCFKKTWCENVKLTKSGFEKCDLTEANFHGAHLEDVDFQNSKLKRADFSNSYLNGANLADASLQGSKFCHTNMTSSTQLFKTDHIEASYYPLYLINRTLILKQATFFNKFDFKNEQSLTDALNKFATSLSSHPQYQLLRECILHDFLRQMRELPGELASKLCTTAYGHDLFTCDELLIKAANTVSHSMHRLFSNTKGKEPDLIESPCQVELRTAMGG